MEKTAELPLRWQRLASAAALGALIGSALTALAVAPIRTSVGTERAPVTREWPKPPLDRAWRGYRTPVDVDRMFRTRGLEAEHP